MRLAPASHARTDAVRLEAQTTAAPPAASTASTPTNAPAVSSPATAAPHARRKRTEKAAANPPASTDHRARAMGTPWRRYWATSHPLAGAAPPGTRLVRPVAAAVRP